MGQDWTSRVQSCQVNSYVGSKGIGMQNHYHNNILNSTLKQCELTFTTADGSTLTDSNLHCTSVIDSTLKDVLLVGGSLTNAHVERAIINDCYLRGVEVTGSFLQISLISWWMNIP